MAESKLGNFLINYYNRAEFLDLKKEIWTKGEYFFEPSTAESQELSVKRQSYSPLIFDCGAHIGMASLYWLNLYPEAKIWAFEPNPLLYSVLEENIAQNYLADNLKIFPYALAKNFGEKEFFIDKKENVEEKWLMSGSFHSGAWNHQQKTQATKVKTVKLSQYLSESLVAEKRSWIDLVKVDIEGAESEVLTEAGDFLSKIKRLMIEYHPTSGQKITRLIQLLQAHHFIFEIHEVDSGQLWQPKNNFEPRNLLFIEANRKF